MCYSIRAQHAIGDPTWALSWMKSAIVDSGVHAVKQLNTFDVVLCGTGLLIASVVLPAVWSRKAGRRKAALEVLKIIIGALRARR